MTRTTDRPSRCTGWSLLALGGLVSALTLPSGCNTVACAHGDFGSAECRVAAENHYAQVTTSSGVSLHFAEPGSDDATVVAPLGLLEPTSTGVRVRPSTLMDFDLVIEAGTLGATSITLELENVASDAVLSLGPSGAEVELAPGMGTTRNVEVSLTDDVLWLRGRRDCPLTFRVVVAGDVQTNPVQFERVLDSLHDELADGAATGQPLLGFALLGDLAEVPVEEELRHVSSLLRNAVVPVSVTPGNHDVHGDVMAIYNRVFGAGTYAQAVCTAKLALFDTGAGGLAASVQARLPELLARSSFDFLVGGGHYPAYPGRTGNSWGDEDASFYLLSELARNEADLWVAGHYHSWEDTVPKPVGDREVRQIISGTAGASQGSGVPTFGYTRLTFSPAGLSSCFVEVLPPGRVEAQTGTATGIRYCP
ncbi:MAG: metallophosphoesterase [Deltaproteobacteria bacterium]|nr:metallophosphoesterase [Deltaproteobacteria bacterium]